MTLRGRLTFFGAASVLATLALGGTVYWGASKAQQILLQRQRTSARAEACQSLSLAVPALLHGPAADPELAETARRQLDLAAGLFAPGDGAEEVEELRQVVEAALQAGPVGAGDLPDAAAHFARDVLGPITRLAAHNRQIDADTARLSAESIARARAIAGVVAALGLMLGLLGATAVAPRLRRGLAALEAGARRVSAGDLTTRIALDGTDELASLGSALDAMAARLHGTMLSRGQAEALVRDRTAELERTQQDLAARLAQLEAVRIQLDAADRLVAADRLARGLTHEINNPLAILLADVEFAYEELEARAAAAPGGPPDEVVSALGEARQAGRRISLIVRELMSFSRDRSAGDLGPTDLAQALAHAVRLAGPEIRQHATLVVELPPGPVLVQGNQARLGQAFLELLLGAAAAVAGAGGAGSQVSLVVRQEDGGAQVEVRDDGLPIPAELRPHLFDPFFTPTAGFAADSAGLRGAGLGLASCFGIIQAAGGRLEVDSAPGTGTVFRAWLPAASSQSRLALRAPAASRNGGRPRLLVVDADPFDCATAYRTLSRDFDVAPHASVPSALAVVRAGERFDLILCDPASGRALAAALAADGSDQAGRLVFAGDDPAPGEAAAQGGPARIPKPISVEQVLALVRGGGRPA